MTNKEAIEIVKGNFGELGYNEMCKQCDKTQCGKCVDIAFDMAINALKIMSRRCSNCTYFYPDEPRTCEDLYCAEADDYCSRWFPADETYLELY